MDIKNAHEDLEKIRNGPDEKLRKAAGVCGNVVEKKEDDEDDEDVENIDLGLFL